MALFLCLISASLGCRISSSGLGKDVVASVGGDPITVEDFKVISNGEMPATLDGKKSLLGRLINNKLASKAAVAEGLMTAPEAIARMEEFYNDRLPDFLSEKIGNEIKVSDEEMLMYKKEKDLKPVFGVSVLIAPTMEEAKAAQAELDKGAGFKDAAAKHSVIKGETDTEFSLDEGLYPAGVKAVLNRMKPGELSPIMKMDIGYAIFKLNYRKEPEDSWKAAEENARNEIKQRKFAAEMAKLVDKLRSSAKVKLETRKLPGGEVQYFGAVVDDVEIKMDPNLFNPSGDPHSPHGSMNAATLKEALNKRINKILLSQEARRMGLHQDPQFKREINLKREEVLAGVIIEKVRGTYEPTQQDLEDYYEGNKEKYAVKTRLRISRILLASKEDAEAAMMELKAGKDFASIARERSTDATTKDKGGDVGFVKPEKLKEPLKSTLSKMKAGDISGVLKSEYGYEVLKATERKEGGEPVMSTITTTIKKRVVLTKQSERVEAFFKKLQEKYEIKINEKLLESIK